MFVAFKFYVEKFFGVVEGEEIFDVGVDPELWCWRKWFFAGKAKLSPDTANLVFVDMGVIDDVSHLSGAKATDVSDEVAEGGILRDVEGHAKWDVVAADCDDEIEAVVYDVPLGVPDAGRKGGGG